MTWSGSVDFAQRNHFTATPFFRLKPRRPRHPSRYSVRSTIWPEHSLWRRANAATLQYTNNIEKHKHTHKYASVLEQFMFGFINKMQSEKLSHFQCGCVHAYI